MTSRPSTPEERAKAQEMHDAGMSVRQIAKTLGRNNSVVYAWLHPEFRTKKYAKERKRRESERKLFRDPAAPRMSTSDERSRAIELYESDAPIREIARMLKRPHSTVRLWCMPEVRDQQRIRTRAWFAAHKDQMRERVRKRTPEDALRIKLRNAARAEAASTGAPVEQIYERWGVS